MMLSALDILEIQQLINLYWHLLDGRQFSRVDDLFAHNAVYDVTDFDSGIRCGTQAIAKVWGAAGDKHPLGHHATNIIITEEPDGTVRVASKGIGVRPNGSVSSVLYRDIVARSPGGVAYCRARGYAASAGENCRAPLTSGTALIYSNGVQKSKNCIAPCDGLKE
jgi:SnoaL-like domain